MNIRHLQFLGAACLSAFCHRYTLNHKVIRELISQQVSLSTAEDLPLWDEEGTLLDLNGRGDVIPEELVSLMPEHLKNDFDLLVDYSTEIGVIDMFGENTEEPSKYLLLCLEILKKHGISTLFDSGISLPAKFEWGEPISAVALQAKIKNYPDLKTYLNDDIFPDKVSSFE